MSDGDDGVFLLAIYDAKKNHSDGIDWDTSSHYFNVIRNEVAEKTHTATSSASGATRTQVAAAGAIGPASAQQSTPAKAKKDSGGLSTGAVAGISVGVTVGAVLLLGGFGFLVGRRMFGKRSRQGYEPPRGDESKKEPQVMPQYQQQYQPGVQDSPQPQAQAFHYAPPI